ncbi:MAG: hypothetical protein LBD84_07420 [Campylobacteraceae bacterium]|jgi:hypothetical protein|nr:hypothetical protein [Campylobacteraceae bacterium]
MKPLIYLTNIHRFFSSCEKFSKLFFVFLLVFASTQLHAYLSINDVRINDGSGHKDIIYDDEHPNITVIATLTNDGPSYAYKRWWSTAYIVDGDPSSCKVINNSDKGLSGFQTMQHTIDDITYGSNSEKDAFLASLPMGKHKVTFKVSGSINACTAEDASPGFTITVERRCVSKCKFFDCQHLYIGGNIGRNPNYAEVTVTGTATFTGTEFSTGNENNNPTLAIGPYKGNITLYWWDYDMRTLGTGIGSKSPIYYIQNGSVTSAPIPQNPSSFEFKTDRLSGGTANQKTGEIYLLPEPGGSKPNKILSILSPDSNGVFSLNKQSPQLNFTTNTDDKAYASDMAIDADGNAYLLVRDSSSGINYRLLKINPQDWSYDFVQLQNNIDISNDNKIWGMAFLNGKLYAAEEISPPRIHAIDPIKGGKTEFGTVTMKTGSSPYGYGIDDIASCQTASAITGKVYLDKNGDGKIDSNDQENGKYQVVSNVVVEIYDSMTNKPLGFQTTNSFGEYSFLVELQKTYYIRLRQPQVNGANTHQTWASGGEFEWKSDIGIGSNGINKVTPACYNNGAQIQDSPQTLTSYSGKEWKRRYVQDCYGAKANGIDPSEDGIKNANYYTTVIMETDLSVAHADFALASVDRSDTPNGKIGNTTYNFGEAAHVFISNAAYLGDKIDSDINSFTGSATNDDAINAKGDDNSGSKRNDDDGIEVKEANNSDPNAFTTIQGKEFINGNLYTFRVKVPSDKNYLNAWANFVNTDTLTKYTFVNTYNNAEAGRFITNSVVNNDGNYTNLVYKDGYLEFNYTIPDTYYTNEKFNDNNTTKAYMRFRYSNTSIDDMNFQDPPRGDVYWNTKPWAIDGEVEDYMIYYHYIPRPNYVPANLTVVNENFDKASGDKFNVNDHALTGLFTQIADKPFKAKIVAHNDGVILEQFAGNVTVIVDFVENNLSAPMCDPEYMPILQRLGNVNLSENNKNEVVKTMSNTILNPVTKDGTFMLTYYYSDYNGSYNTTTCSDTFALRPATFKIDGLSGNLIGRKVENGTIKALGHNNNVTLNYNQNANKITHKNSTLVPYSPDCNTTEFNITVSNAALQVNTTNFKKGESNISILYENIGAISTSFMDSNWTQVDNYYPNNIHDCIPNSSSNNHSTSDQYKGRVGCDIALDTMLKFIPKTFKSSIGISNFDNTYTYLSNNNSMYANIFVDISALLYDDTIATNYHQNCFAGNVDYKIELINENLTDWDNRSNVTQRIKYFTTTSTANVTNSINEIAYLFTSQGNFTNGTANTAFGFNFGRPQIEKPFTVAYDDFNVTSIKDDNGVAGAGVEDGGGNANLYYGRTHSKFPIYSVYGNETNATIYYEIYCSNCNKTRYTNGMKLDGEYPSWYINTAHNAERAGNVTRFEANTTGVFLRRDTLSNTDKNSSFDVTSGSEILGVIKKPSIKYTPYDTKIKMAPHSWLVNEPEFEVIFEGDGGSWAGYGQSNINGTTNKTGRIIQSNASKNIDIRIDW